jgi:hypothetical protein
MELIGGASQPLGSGGYQSGDAVEGAKIVELDVVDIDAATESLLELKQQLHELERVDHAGLDKIGVRGRHFDLKALEKHCIEALDDLVGHVRFLV